MKRIPNQLIKDYLIVECAWMCITFLAHPMLLTPDQRAVPLPVFKIVHGSFFLLTLVLSEIIVTYIFQNSFTYSAGFWGRLKHFALCAVIGVPIFNIFLNQSNTIMMWDFSRYYYAWFDIDGNNQSQKYRAHPSGIGFNQQNVRNRTNQAAFTPAKR